MAYLWNDDWGYLAVIPNTGCKYGPAAWTHIKSVALAADASKLRRVAKKYWSGIEFKIIDVEDA